MTYLPSVGIQGLMQHEKKNIARGIQYLAHLTEEERRDLFCDLSQLNVRDIVRNDLEVANSDYKRYEDSLFLDMMPSEWQTEKNIVLYDEEDSNIRIVWKDPSRDVKYTGLGHSGQSVVLYVEVKIWLLVNRKSYGACIKTSFEPSELTWSLASFCTMLKSNLWSQMMSIGLTSVLTSDTCPTDADITSFVDACNTIGLELTTEEQHCWWRENLRWKVPTLGRILTSFFSVGQQVPTVYMELVRYFSDFGHHKNNLFLMSDGAILKYSDGNKIRFFAATLNVDGWVRVSIAHEVFKKYELSQTLQS